MNQEKKKKSMHDFNQIHFLEKMKADSWNYQDSDCIHFFVLEKSFRFWEEEGATW